MGIFYFWSKILKKLRGAAIVNSEVCSKSKIESGSLVVNSSIDKYSFCGYNCEILNCEIGRFCSIANNVIIGGAMHPIDWVSSSPVFYEGRDSIKTKFSKHKRIPDKKTKIGHDVWIGQNVLIKQGVTIGSGSVVGMGSVVTKDVAPYEIVAGNPAKVIKKRFDDNIIKKLLEINWWNMNDEELKVLAKHITNPDQFIKEFEK